MYHHHKHPMENLMQHHHKEPKDNLMQHHQKEPRDNFMQHHHKPHRHHQAQKHRDGATGFRDLEVGRCYKCFKTLVVCDLLFWDRCLTCVCVSKLQLFVFWVQNSSALTLMLCFNVCQTNGISALAIFSGYIFIFIQFFNMVNNTKIVTELITKHSKKQTLKWSLN